MTSERIAPITPIALWLAVLVAGLAGCGEVPVKSADRVDANLGGGSDASSTGSDATPGGDAAESADAGPIDTGSFNNACTKDSDCAAQFPDLGACQQAMCDKGTGVCKAENKANGTVISAAKCEQGDKGPVHTAAVTCTDGAVGASKPQPCDGDGPCAKATCVADKGCGIDKLNATACDDGSLCTAKDVCQDGVCTGSAELICDGGVCTSAMCDPKTGKCVEKFYDDKTPCDDGDKCTSDDLCMGGKCGGAKIDCDDGKVCTDDSCDPKAGCVSKNNTAKCEDGEKCTTDDVCKDGKCTPGKATCECKVNADCPNSAGNPCMATTVCDQTTNKCKVSKGPITCPPTGEPCQVAFCDATIGGCANKAEKPGEKCDDGDKCTTSDACKSGKCAGVTGQVKCPDATACTTSKCDAKQGCVTEDKAGACDDGDKCTTGDVCKDGTCQAPGTLACDDKQECTLDKCDAKVGCVFDGAAMANKSCDDGDVCTETDTCSGGKCTAGKAKSCDDGKKCTADTCDKKAGCNHAPISGCDTCNGDPQCKGVAMPTWKLQDLNPTSPFSNQTYGIDKFKGQVTVLFMLHGY